MKLFVSGMSPLMKFDKDRDIPSVNTVFSGAGRIQFLGPKI